MKTVRFAVIGTNFITDRFLRAASDCKAFKLSAVYSRTMERAKEYADLHGAEYTYDSLEDLAASTEVDAVYIASPNCAHAEQSIQMMNAGKHVLCEKPIASNHMEFMKMKDAAQKNNVVLMEAMRSVFMPGFHVVEDNLPKLGTIRRATFQYCQYSSRYDNYKKGIIENAFRPELSNGALMDLGVYCVHPMVKLFGMPQEICSSSLKLSNGADGEGTILFRYPQMIGEMMYSKISDSRVPSQIQGENGTMIIDHIADLGSVTIVYRDGTSEKPEILQDHENLYYEAETFLHLVCERKISHPYLENSGKELRVMDQVRSQQGIHFPADQ